MPGVVEWLAPFEEFLQKTGLQQSLRALQIESLVLSSKPSIDTRDSLRRLSECIQNYLAQEGSTLPIKPAEEAHADSDRHAGHAQDIVQNTSNREETTQMMDEFIAQQRKGIDRSNRDEFLTTSDGSEETCARTDAKGANCGVKLQAELVQNNNTALGRSTDQNSKRHDECDSNSTETQPLSGLEERVENVRDHLNVQFVPETADVYHRVSALEDRIMMLEREFPPWSAEHFNQPRRRYTQPPPVTVYRILPPAPTPAAMMSAPASTQMPARKATQPHRTQSQKAQPQATPKRQALPPAKRKKAAYTNSPLDKAGRPIFHACGRGVNSSLTRSVLAQLQGKQKDTPAEAKHNASPSEVHEDK